MKRHMGIGIAVLILAGGAWYAVRAGWFEGPEIPNDPPTAEELKRMADIETTSSQIAPDAKPGAGVFAPGTLPPSPVETGTTTDTSASSTAAE